MKKKIPLDKAKPGMELAQQVLRPDGVLLSQKGQALTEGLIKTLERLNFATVMVEIGAVETGEERAARLEKQRRAIRARFARVRKSPVLMALMETMLKRLEEDDA